MPTVVYKCDICSKIWESYDEAEGCQLSHGGTHKYKVGQKFRHQHQQGVQEITKLFFKTHRGVSTPYYSFKKANGRIVPRAEHSLLADVASFLLTEL